MQDDKLNELLVGDEPEEKPKNENGFKPRFNVREEFALWIREQFPNLKEHAKKKKVYDELEERSREVYEAALGAVNHGAISTEACAASRLRYGWKKFEEGFKTNSDPKKRAKSLEAFVGSLENLSISLGGDKHFTECGKFLSGGSYSYIDNLYAFIYRVGDENGKDTKYLVFDKPQEFEAGVEGSNPILIGEFTQLTKWKFESLQKIVSKFKGPEVEFIKKVDIEVPEYGSYSGYGNPAGSTYRYSGTASVSVRGLDSWSTNYLYGGDY